MHSLSTILEKDGIFGPASDEQKRLEGRLTRYFEREYQRCIGHNYAGGAGRIATHNGQMMEKTRDLMVRHYDETFEFFSSFLDSRYRAYSMGYYGEDPKDILGSAAELEDAQHAKLKLIAQRARIEGNERILNIGCGFGSFETFLLARFPNIEVVGITPSKVQVNYLRRRMGNRTDPLSSGRFRLIEGAFDKLTVTALGVKRYDLVVSIAVFEQVINMRAVLQRIAALLKPNGRTFHHFITSQRLVPRLLDPKSTRIGLYFPGGRVWPHDELSKHTEHFGLKGSWFVNGLNYWRTLDEWHRRYWSNIPRLCEGLMSKEKIRYWNDQSRDANSVNRAKEPDADLPVVDEDELEKLRLLAGGDGEFLHDMITNFERDADHDIKDLEAAVARRDWQGFRDSAHALKGAALYLGLKRLAVLSAQAQKLDRDEFELRGIASIRAIRGAAETALEVLRQRLGAERKLG
jgi:cyclopropane-fatty-acyl-phospholipid synthase